MTARARSRDPITSHIAAQEAESSGRATSQRQICLIEVWKQPGRTAAVTAGMQRHVPSRRLPELRESGQVTNGPERECSVTGHLSMTWYPLQEDK
jgi:hypothetical protein